LRIWRRERCGRTLLGSTILSGTKLDSRTAGPGARSAEGLGPWMGPSIPRGRHATVRRIEADVLSDKDSRRLALERAARKGWAHGWAQQSPADVTQQCSAPKQAFCVSGCEKYGRILSGYSAHPAPRPSGQRLRHCSLQHPAFASDKFARSVKDSRRLAPQREGLGPWMRPTIPADLTPQCSAPKSACFAGGEGVRTDSSTSLDASRARLALKPTTVPVHLYFPTTPRFSRHLPNNGSLETRRHRHEATAKPAMPLIAPSGSALRIRSIRSTHALRINTGR
jgi:hypothetical protein